MMVVVTFEHIIQFENPAINEQMQLVEQICQIFGFNLIMYYIFKKSSKGMNATTRKTLISKRLYPLILVSLVVDLVFVIIVDFKALTGQFEQRDRHAAPEPPDQAKNEVCKDPFFVSTTGFELLIVGCFTVLVLKLEKHTQSHIKAEMEKYGLDEAFFSDIRVINGDLVFILKFYIIISIWQFINSLVTFINANSLPGSDTTTDKCNHWVEQKDLNLLPLVFSRSCSYFLLWYPVVRMFSRPQHIKTRQYYSNKRATAGDKKRRDDSINISQQLGKNNSNGSSSFDQALLAREPRSFGTDESLPASSPDDFLDDVGRQKMMKNQNLVQIANSGSGKDQRSSSGISNTFNSMVSNPGGERGDDRSSYASFTDFRDHN